MDTKKRLEMLRQVKQMTGKKPVEAKKVVMESKGKMKKGK